MKNLIALVLATLGMIALIRVDAIMIQHTQRDVASVYMDLHK